MKLFTLLQVAALLLTACNQNHERRVLETERDERGLISVIFADGKDTMGFDYLTPEQFRKEFPKGHLCKWNACPYTGVTMFDRHEAVSEYTECDEGTDCYCIDWLHFEYPTYDYDKLDSLLFTK